MANYNRDSWRTDSSYNADDNYDNSSLATDPRTFSVRASQPYAMIPLPDQFQLYTIEEQGNQEEDLQPCPATKARRAQSLAIHNEDLIEKSLKSIALIRSRLLQQQETNRKKKCEFQQIRDSLDNAHSLVHLVYDPRCNKTWIEFTADDIKISPSIERSKLSKFEKEGTSSINDSSESLDVAEPTTPTLSSVAPPLARGRSESSLGPVRAFKAMSITANVPTTPTKRVPTTTSELHNLQYRLSFENLTTESDLTLGQVTPVQQHHRLIPSPSKTPESYYTAQLNKFNLEKSAALSNDRVVHHKNSSGNLSTTSRAITVTTSHDDEWDRHDELTTTGSNYNDDQSETASLRNLSIEPSQPPMMSTKFKQFTRTESTGFNFSS
ncbi:hypothetical protein Pst134EA_005478 [Puccinia striiformis f. sp. tritici]|uniref:hypothetical protein n=1 Tax=Puccinia striiformis f. sp. tritici TaxID=168172 RepID=UPI0020083086|nr:hypothetical protein Pst134EA_005478 [Puccinia striiformis f. sp. tritici]KAH9471586.1 hypothetical protein Pst134EA_005478 [Puccinia striiformis f. sp. tritici]KAI9618911.1 hypothetical protein H4Q26_012166 [Puccinia striiformis f. sp. tritici PST-130]